MESFPIDTLPSLGDIHLACFTGVKNAADLKERLQVQDKTLTFAMVESNLVSKTHPILTLILPFEGRLYSILLLCGMMGCLMSNFRGIAFSTSC